MYSEKELECLREAVKARLSEKRFRHTLGVEKMAAYLSECCLPEKKQALRAAALLHDVAKEIPHEEMLDLIEKGNINLTEQELMAEPTLHSYASVYLIKRDFPRFADENVLLACKNHTVGDPDMGIFEEIIFLSDYIEEGRSYEDAVRLRASLLSSLGNDREENVKQLHVATASSIAHTVKILEERKKYINPKTVLTRNAILSKI